MKHRVRAISKARKEESSARELPLEAQKTTEPGQVPIKISLRYRPRKWRQVK